jgi:hypothetical protein
MLQPAQFVFEGRESLPEILCITNSPTRTDKRHEGQDDNTSNQCQDHQNDQAFHDKLAAGQFVAARAA